MENESLRKPSTTAPYQFSEFFILLSQQSSETLRSGQKATAMLRCQLAENKAVKYCSLLSV